jgi:sugar lactone lactonase YvrE
MQRILGAAALAAAMLTIHPARAATLYATSLEGSELLKVDTVTNTVTLVENTPESPDSLVIDSQGRFVYTTGSGSELRRFDPVGNTDTLLASGVNGLSEAQDVVLDPGGNTILVSNYFGNSITRTNLTTLTTTTLISGFSNAEGLAYDGSGDLFALGGTRGSATFLYQIDPITGAILRQSAAFDSTNSLDGLTYDPFSGLLYATSILGNTLYSIDPTNLATVHNLGSIGGPDGLTADSNGLLYIASRDDSSIHSYNVATQAFTTLTNVPGLDDLAPASGLGSGNNAPEPGTWALAMTALVVIAFRRAVRAA